MTQTSANTQLAEILRAHDVATQEEGNWLRVSPGGPRLQAVFSETRSEPGVLTRTSSSRPGRSEAFNGRSSSEMW